MSGTSQQTSESASDTSSLSIPKFALVLPAATTKEIVSRWLEVQALKVALLDRDTDMVPIGSKLFVKDSGVEKLGFAYNLTDEILRQDKEVDSGRTTWRMWVRVTAPNGRQSTDVGAASSDERKFAHPEHDTYALCHTRARNRAILGILGLGEVSFEEMSSADPARTSGGISPEALDSLPWKSMPRNANGAWIYSNLPEAAPLVQALQKASDKTLTLAGYRYVISGDNGKFVNRFVYAEETSG
jgi:hypothetical protein